MGNEESSLEVELDDGNIAFSLNVKNNVCIDCGHKEFSAHQSCVLDIVVDSKNNFIRNQGKTVEGAVSDSNNPYGTYHCMDCGKEYEDLSDLSKNVDNVYDLINEKLRDEGIGVLNDRTIFEEALNKYHKDNNE